MRSACFKIAIRCVVLLSCVVSARGAEVFDTDICVYGATSGGVISAVQAVRLGKSAIVAESSNHLGGLTTGGLGATDVGNANAIQGISREFYNRIAAKYAVTAPKFTFEPKVAKEVFQNMLDESGLSVRSNQRLAAVKKSGLRIIELTMEDGTIYRARMFIDASYEGDLIARAGVGYTLGRESTATYGETLNGIRATTPAHQFAVNVDPYVVPGDSSSGLLPFIQPGDGGTPGTGDARIQAYNYRLCLTQAANRLPIQPPPGYNAAEYELLARLVEGRIAKGDTLNLRSFMNIASMPNGKTDINNNGAFSTDSIGANYSYPEGTYDERAQIAKAHENYIRGFFTFLANSPRIPASIRAEMQSWGLPPDEFFSTAGWPAQMYVREARRMVSDYVMTQADCASTRAASDSVGLASYTMDSHNCQRIVQGGFVKNEGDVQSPVPQPFPISYRAIIPKVGECENLVVPFCVSASHIAFGSVRMEPVFMILAQSAATAASFAIDDDVSLQQLDYAKLKAQLLADKQLLTWGTAGGGSIVDNTDGLAVTITGDWVSSGSIAGFIGPDYIHNNNMLPGQKSVRYAANLPAGRYEVSLRWTASSNRATNVPVDVVHAAGTTTVTVNQQQQGSVWVPIATVDFAAGAGSVTIRTDGTNGYVIVDAVRFVDVNNPTLPALQIIASDPTATERGPTAGRVTVMREGDFSQPLAVGLTVSGSAASGVDYASIPTTLSFAASEATKSIVIMPIADSLIEGNDSVIISIAPGAGYQAGQLGTATVTIKDRPLDAWKFQSFTAVQLNDPAISGDDADPNGNGLTNLVEYAFGRPPLTPSLFPMTVPLIDLTVPAAPRLQLMYERPYPAPPDLGYITEVSDDLLTWTSGSTETEEVTSTPAGSRQAVLVRDRKAQSGPTRFMRLRLEKR